jgi:gliding motility-associated-like protein
MMACGVQSVSLNGTTTSTNSVTYNWAGPNAGSLSNSTIANPIAFDTGDYTLTVTDQTNGCSSTSTVTISQATVTSAFSANPTTGNSPLSVNFTNTSSGSINYFWDFGDASTSTSANPVHTFTVGTYTVALTVTEGSCISTSTTVIIVENPISLEIPNVFTPNGDGVNEVFFIRSNGIKEISLQIFNRWGQKLYDFTGQNAQWDGITNRGTSVPEGTYFYFVKAIGFDDKTIEQQGTVNLFK